MVRGVTYGGFRPGPDGVEFPSPRLVQSDLAGMAAAGINAVRTYATPPEWLLEEALRHGVRVLAGLPWEQHVAFLDDRSGARRIAARVRDAARSCAGHPALLGFAVGNEIPGAIVRWHGRRRVEAFVERLYDEVKGVDPDSLVTYVNYPTTEYLQLGFVDFACFNVYLERRDHLEAYLRRLHNLVDDKPLLLAEIGLDSRRNGLDAQADAVEWQIDAALESGCAGTFVFAWTDEWHRGGVDVEDWDFGLVTRDRRPKPALGAARRAYGRDPLARLGDWPRISVVVCTYNGDRWLPGCFDALDRVRYPDWEVIVVSDGSTDRTEQLTRERGHRLVASPENRGLATARNLGYRAATGEIVAYLDDDARPDADWLRHLALGFRRTTHAALGGPNVPPPDDGLVADCVAHAPGGPVSVLVDDELAEHIPGCNMAVRRICLEALDGFDPRYWIAGDDVDLCWRLQREGFTIGYCPSALVWHHRRGSVRRYLKQQYEYGKAEGLLYRKWPARYNRAGHLSWVGRVYGPGAPGSRPPRRARVRYGSWGSAAFQSIYDARPGALTWLPALPEWYLVLGGLAALALLGAWWRPFLLVLPVLAAAGLLLIAHGVAGGMAALPAWRDRPPGQRLGLVVLTALLHVLQPLARLTGRLRGGVTPWRRHRERSYALPRPHRAWAWSERWVAPEDWLQTVEARLQSTGHAVARGGDVDRWDLQVRGGPLGVVRLLSVVEEHGGGRQLARFRWWPRGSRAGIAVIALFAVLAAASGSSAPTAVTLGAVAVAVAALMARDCAAAAGAVAQALSAPLTGPAPEAIPEPVPISSPARQLPRAPSEAAVAPLARGDMSHVRERA